MITDIKTPVTAKGAATRLRILEAAEKVIGERGYYNSSISHITQTAKVAQGTFYLYFAHKEQVLLELAQHILEQVCAIINNHETIADGVSAYMQFSQDRPAVYQVLHDLSQVDETLYKSFYAKLADNIGSQLPDNNPSTPWMIIGIYHFLGLQKSVHRETNINDSIDNAAQFISKGLTH